MRRWRLLLVLALALGAVSCQDEEPVPQEEQSVVVIQVTFDSNVPTMYQVRVNAHLGADGLDSTLTFPLTVTDRAIQSGDTLALLIPITRMGMLDLNISGLNRDGQAVATGSGQTIIAVGDRVTKTIPLSPL